MRLTHHPAMLHDNNVGIERSWRRVSWRRGKRPLEVTHWAGSRARVPIHCDLSLRETKQYPIRLHTKPSDRHPKQSDARLPSTQQLPVVRYPAIMASAFTEIQNSSQGEQNVFLIYLVPPPFSVASLLMQNSSLNPNKIRSATNFAQFYVTKEKNLSMLWM